MKLKSIFKNIIPILVGILVALVIKNYVLINVRVPTASMEPTILIGDLMLSSRVTYLFEEPKRGDIITFISPVDNETVYVKRIIGLPGETITITDGKVYINDSDTPLSEEHINFKENPTGDFGPYVVPENSYFVMGDNRNESYDSRYWETTNYVSKDDIISKIWFRYYSSGKLIFDKME